MVVDIYSVRLEARLPQCFWFSKIFLCLSAALILSDLLLSFPQNSLCSVRSMKRSSWCTILLRRIYFSDFTWATFLYYLSLPGTSSTGLGWQGREQRLRVVGFTKTGKQFVCYQGSIWLFCASRWIVHANDFLYSWRPVLASEVFTEILSVFYSVAE